MVNTYVVSGKTMSLPLVCKWLRTNGHGEQSLDLWYILHNLMDEDNAVDKKLIQALINISDPTGLIFKQLECEVPTHMEIV